MQVIATDTQGNEFIKTITTRTNANPYNDGLIICFGWPIEYYAEDLLKHYPYQKDMCIDIGSRNHKGLQVSISAEQMDKIVENLIMN